MAFVKKIFLFLSLFLLYFIIKEFLELYVLMQSIHPIAGYLTLAFLFFAIIYFIALPVIGILKIPEAPGPVLDERDEIKLIKGRLDRFRENNYLTSIEYNIPMVSEENALRRTYLEAASKLKDNCDNIRKKYVRQLFISSAISQNGFIDSILILSSSINLIKEIFVLYNGRTSNKDLIAIGKKVYFSMAIGGSEVTEYASEEIISKLSSDVLKSIPFFDKIAGSITDGFVNAALLTRVSYITENYCVMTYLKDAKELYPAPNFIIKTVKHLTSDLVGSLCSTLKRYSREKRKKVLSYRKYIVNPTGFVFEKAIESLMRTKGNVNSDSKRIIVDVTKATINPIGFGFEKFIGIFTRNKQVEQ